MKRMSLSMSFIELISAVLILGGFIALRSPWPVFANESASISFFTANVDVDSTPDNELEDFQPVMLDMSIPEGSIIRTGKNALCEVTMPGGNLLRIASGAVFKVERLEVSSETGSRTQRFNLIFGKLKAKVNKLSTPDSKFEVVSGTALAGVRGTQFGVSYDGLRSEVLVFEGSVDLQSAAQGFKPIAVRRGKMGGVAVGGGAGPVKKIPKALLNQWEEEFEGFERGIEENGQKGEKAEKDSKGEKGGGGESSPAGFLTLSASIGTVTIDGELYAHWIFTPELRSGKLGIGLAFPAIFAPSTGLLGFDDWENHDEWNFESLDDGFHDALIKLAYASWGALGDQFYVRLGSIDTFFLGHGFIVDGYTNMISFPEELKVGLQLKADGKLAGFEGVVGDLSKPELLGGRFYARPFGSGVPFALGVTTVHDRPKPDSFGWPAGTTDEDQLPRIIAFGADAEFPVVNQDRFSMKLFADAAKLAYSYPEAPPSLSSAGVNSGEIGFVEGFGAGFGLMGSGAHVFTYRAEYRYIFNYYEPGFINAEWDNRRLFYPAFFNDLILAQNSAGYEDTNTAGWLLGGSVVLLKKLELGLGFGSYRRWTGTGTEPVKSARLRVALEEGLVPRVSASLSYDRTDNLENVFKEPFDENTLLAAVLCYSLGPGVILSGRYNRAYVYDDRTGTFEPVDSLCISTAFKFL